jgi:hypothetical protein
MEDGGGGWILDISFQLLMGYAKGMYMDLFVFPCLFSWKVYSPCPLRLNVIYLLGKRTIIKHPGVSHLHSELFARTNSTKYLGLA